MHSDHVTLLSFPPACLFSSLPLFSCESPAGHSFSLGASEGGSIREKDTQSRGHGNEKEKCFGRQEDKIEPHSAPVEKGNQKDAGVRRTSGSEDGDSDRDEGFDFSGTTLGGRRMGRSFDRINNNTRIAITSRESGRRERDKCMDNKRDEERMMMKVVA